MPDSVSRFLSKTNVLAFVSSIYLFMAMFFFIFALGNEFLLDRYAQWLVITVFCVVVVSILLWQKVANRHFLALHSFLALGLCAYLAIKSVSSVYILPIVFPFALLWNTKFKFNLAVGMFLVAVSLKIMIVLSSVDINYWELIHACFVLLVGVLGVVFDRNIRLAWVKLKNQVNQCQADQEGAKAKLYMAEQAFEQMIDRFVEQFKEPIAVMMGMNTVLQNHETSRRRLELLARQSKTGQYVADLFSQLEASATNKTPLFTTQKSEFLLSDVLTVLENQVSALTSPQRKVEIIFDETIYNNLMGDKLRLLQLLHILLGAACERMKDGMVSLSVVNRTPDDANLIMQFTVSAVGELTESSDDTANNFGSLDDPFFLRIFHCLGYDIPFCKALLIELGSELVHHEEPGSLTYSFELGFQSSDDDQSVGEFFDLFKQESEPDWYGALQGYRVLVVDDSEDTLFVLSELLDLAGAEVDAELDGNQAILRVLDGAKRYDVVIMDLQMPSLSGAEVSQAIRQQFSKGQLPIMGLSVSNRPEEIKASLAAGMNDFMVKPFNINHFIDFAIAHVNRRKLNHDLPAQELNTLSSLEKSQKSEKGMSSQFLTVPEGYDVNAAIANLGNDKQLYLSILDATLREWGTNMNQLQAALKRNDIYYAQHVISRFANNAVMLGATDMDAYLRQLNFSLGLRAMDKDGEQQSLQELGRELEERIWQASSVLKSVANSLAEQ